MKYEFSVDFVCVLLKATNQEKMKTNNSLRSKRDSEFVSVLTSIEF